MRRLIFGIGCAFVAVGLVGLAVLLTGQAHRWVGHAAEGQLWFIFAAGLLALIVVGILMVVGESDSRG